jgi:hypothetical protein
MNPVLIQQLMDSAGLAIKQSRDALQAAGQAGAQMAGMRQEMARMAQNAADLQTALQRVQMQRQNGDPGIQRVENIPGRRVPFDLFVDIPIGDNITSVQQGTITISQEGPFVATARMAVFLSTYQFQVVPDPNQPNNKATFAGRSFGRQRPIHSVWDLNDGLPRTQVVMPVAMPGTGAPQVISPSNASPFRSMEADYRIRFENAGSSFPRSNIEIPSAFWVRGQNDPFELGALDVFERGEVLTFQVLPLHPNNPPYGNVFGFGAPNPNYPFLQSGFDAIEGVVDANNPDAGSTDPVTRVASGILTIGFHGYRIVQPAGAGPY